MTSASTVVEPRQVIVDLGERSYPVYVGQNLLQRMDLLLPAIGGKQALIVTNETVAPLYLAPLQEALQRQGQLQKLDVHLIPDGEKFKSFAEYERLLDALLAQGHNRSTTLIALGGGVVGDLTGFAAATFQRGVGFVQIPTTLLAQVDSSVGGKTAINHPQGKNMVGAFYQPTCVLADLDVLQSLPPREYQAGLAETIKYGVIADLEFFEWCEANAAALQQRQPAALAFAIERSVQLKAAVVAADEREQGQRAILNFGHTIGHALEQVTAYDEFLHGEAVAIGMVAAAGLSEHQGLLRPGNRERLLKLLQAVGLPVAFPNNLSQEALIEAMRRDKKVVDSQLRFVLARSIGQVEVNDGVSVQDLREFLSQAAAG